MGLSTKHEADGALSEVSCAHNGYYWLPGKPVHRRTWRMDEEGLTISDRVEGSHGDAEAYFHFHPDVQVQIEPNKAAGAALLPDSTVMTWTIDNGVGRLEPSSLAPPFWECAFGCVPESEVAARCQYSAFLLAVILRK